MKYPRTSEEIVEYQKFHKQLEFAEQWARFAFTGKYRRDGTTPAITHTEAVVSRCKSIKAKIVAWLHDIIEDTWVTEAELRAANIFDEWVFAELALLTFPDGVTFEQYQDQIVIISFSEIATEVKTADILSNLSETPTKKQIVKYATALLNLTKL